jgi:hypothetical protein
MVNQQMTVNGGTITRIAIDAPSRGTIVKAMVIQLTGAMDGFNYTFYDAAAGCPPGTITGADTIDPIAQAAHQICLPRVASTTGTIKDRYTLADGTDGSFSPAGSYANADAGQSDAARKLYMKLNVPGVGAKTFGIFLGIQPIKS